MNLSRLVPLAFGLFAAAAPSVPLRAADVGDPPAIRGKIAAARPELARRQLKAAADSVPEIADWLLLRAAALTDDSLERDSLYTRLTLPAARARIGATEAAARERTGDLAGAARRYDSLGQFTDATRLRLRQAATNQQREALRAGLLSIARQRSGTPAAAEALRFLASPSVVLTPQEQLEVARMASRTGIVLEAALLYSKVVRRGGTAAPDLLAYGRSLAALRRHREAVTAFRRVPSTSPLASQALLGEASSQTRLGQRTAASAALNRVVARFPTDTPAVSRALYLAGALRWDTGDHAGARTSWIPLLERFPEADSIGRAGFLAALALYEEGKLTQAADEWQRVHLLDRGADGQAAGYWAGRAAEEQGDSARAALLWRSVMARDSFSYYAYVSATRLGVPGWLPAARAERFTQYDDLDTAMTRIARLRALGMTPEAGWERAWLIGEPVRSVERLLAVGDAYRRRGDAEGGIAAARAALARGAAKDSRTYRLLYPRHHDQQLAEQAAASGLDPMLLAALIRQESAWNPAARSRVGARGLMQIMPGTGRLIARQLGLRGWRVDQLDEPALNMRFGAFYLGQVLQRFNGDIVRGLAAYNAGPGRVPSWSVGRAAEDQELFIERISFRETRDYVRIIQRNLALYRALYPSAGTS